MYLEHYTKLLFIYVYFPVVCWARGDSLGLNSLLGEWRRFETIEAS